MSEEMNPVVETTEEIVETTPEVVETPAAPAVEEESANVEVPAKFKSIVEAIETMSVLDLNELVKLFEKKFGVSAAAVAVAGPAAAAAEEKSEFTVVLTADGGAKIGVMKVVKEALGLGLKEAKDLVDGIPSTLKENMKKEDAEALKAAIEAAGGKVELK
jgi:large subunit ribosomal protein L7/L12